MAALLAGAELVARTAAHRPFGTLNRVCGPHLECLPVTRDKTRTSSLSLGFSDNRLLTFS